MQPSGSTTCVRWPVVKYLIVSVGQTRRHQPQLMHLVRSIATTAKDQLRPVFAARIRGAGFQPALVRRARVIRPALIRGVPIIRPACTRGAGFQPALVPLARITRPARIRGAGFQPALVWLARGHHERDLPERSRRARHLFGEELFQFLALLAV